MISKKLTFPNLEGEKLSAQLDFPLGGKSVAFAVLAHCFTCSKNLKAAFNITKALTRHQIGVLRFDFTGLGESEGEFSETNFSSNVDDLVAAARFLESEYLAPSIFIGHSLGGAAVLQAASKVPSLKAVATIAAPCDPKHVTRLLTGKREDLEKKGEVEIELVGRKFTIKKQFIDDLEGTRFTQTVGQLRKPLLIMHSPADEVVNIDNAAEIYKAARHPKSFVSLDRADHLLSDPKDSFYAGAIIGTWASKYIGVPFEERPRIAADGYQVVARVGKEGYETEVIAGPHSLIADEPEAVGGTDKGPNPYDLLLSGLGACSAMTLRMYADRKKWPLESVTVRLKHEKIHAADCESCETKEGMLDKIECEIEPVGPLDGEQKQRLLEIADRCPVHRTLTSEIHIVSKLKTER